MNITLDFGESPPSQVGYQLTFYDYGVPEDYPAEDPRAQQGGSMGTMPDQMRQDRTPFAADYSASNPAHQVSHACLAHT